MPCAGCANRKAVLQAMAKKGVAAAEKWIKAVQKKATVKPAR